MHRNYFWITFLSCIIIGVFIYTCITVNDLIHYWRLNTKTDVQKIEWSVVAISEEHYAPFARYQFTANGKPYRGETQWKEGYLNQWAAQEAIERLSKALPPVWYNNSHPALSTLQKTFPLKESLYTALLWLLALYFLGLGYYVGKKA